MEERDLALQHWRGPTITHRSAECAPNSSARTPTTTSAIPINTHSTLPLTAVTLSALPLSTRPLSATSETNTTTAATIATATTVCYA